ncbi:unnamed protein product [Chrysodeixis includens]|uniref:Uncharacterized protein n=1 Tax=Chrysodeixis includens TaxID=689277 RepID=A0A9N8KZ78_CHRIL|nr:unnamed protein product [Chrysodeixis includens]
MRSASRRTCCFNSWCVLGAWYRARLGRPRRAAAAHHRGCPNLPARPEAQTIAYDTVRCRVVGGSVAHVHNLRATFELYFTYKKSFEECS